MTGHTRPKVVGIGLNKTATKSLRTVLEDWGFNHCWQYEAAFGHLRANRLDAIQKLMREHDSFEDWPWPLLYQEIDRWFPDARFVLTTRRSADEWYASLCRMAVRIGPLDEYEIHIYGSSMPQGRRREHVAYYERHNAEVRDYFAGRPGKLIELCVADESSTDRLAHFLGVDLSGEPFPQKNVADRRLYSGDNLALAHLHRLRHQTLKKLSNRPWIPMPSR